MSDPSELVPRAVESLKHLENESLQPWRARYVEIVLRVLEKRLADVEAERDRAQQTVVNAHRTCVEIRKSLG